LAESLKTEPRRDAVIAPKKTTQIFILAGLFSFFFSNCWTSFHPIRKEHNQSLSHANFIFRHKELTKLLLVFLVERLKRSWKFFSVANCIDKTAISCTRMS